MSTETTVKLPRPVPRRVILRRNVAVISRWLHLYLSMVSFAVILFFAITGFTLNHAERLSGHDHVTTYTGVIAAPAMQGADGPDKLAVVEQLRRDHPMRAGVSDFRNDDDQTTISFKGPGYTADAFVQRPSGKYQLIETRTGLIAVMNDLHRGASTGKTWSVIIDASAILLTLVSLTGLLLLFFIYNRRASGFILAAAAAIAILLGARFVVP